MSVVKTDPSVYSLRSLEAAKRLVKAPGFLADSTGAFSELVAENVIRASAANTSVSADAVVMILQAHMGVSLFKQQKDTSRLLAGFVYKMLIPDKSVPTGTRFTRRYKITDQREAQRGTYDTVGNGVRTREYSQVFQHTSKVVTMQFGFLLGITVPSVAEELIRRELEQARTSWELTKTIEVLEYCAAQPTLTDRICQKLASLPRAEKLDSVLTMAELMCGTVNAHPDSFVCVVENARRVLCSDRPEVLVMGDTLFRVVSQDSSAVRTRIACENVKLAPEFCVYTAADEKSRGDGLHEFTMELVNKRELGDGDLAFADDSSFRDQVTEMPVNHILIGGGRSVGIPIALVDGVQMEHGCGRETSTEHKAFSNTQGFKWEYFTVGCTAPALGQISPSKVLSATDSEEVGYKQLAQRSPSVSYLHQYDGAVVCVTLRELHRLGSPRALFGRERRDKLQGDLNAFMRNGPRGIAVGRMAQLAHSDDWYQKIKNPASLLEFDVRNMVVPEAPDDASHGSAAVEPVRWVVRPRVALFNTSAMNSLSNEIAQIGSELLARFGDSEHAKTVTLNLTFLSKALDYRGGAQRMLEMRGKILANQPIRDLEVDGWTRGRLFWSWMADPICAVYMRKALGAKEIGANAPDFTVEEREVLVQLEGLITGVLALFRNVVGDRANSVVASMPCCFSHRRYAAMDGSQATVNERGYPVWFTLDDMDYCNLMYWIILPSLGARVYRRQPVVENEAHAVRDPLRYRDGEPNLSLELGIDGNLGLTVARLTGECVFSRVAPEAFAEDASEQFEPTASRHVSCTDLGFHRNSVVTYMWSIRLRKISGIGNDLAKALLGMHYSTLLTHDVVRDHYDTVYYSGLSYLMFRGVRFTGCGVSLMQQKSALYALGTQVLCNPTANNTHQVCTVNQYCESVVIPDTLESPGLYIPNLYMKDVRGGDVHLEGRGGPYDMVIADAFNGFCPESDSACGYRRPYIFTTGRSQSLQGLTGEVPLDPLMRSEAYTCMPTLLRPFSSALRSRGRRRGDGGEDSNHSVFCDALHAAEFEKSVLDHVGDLFKDTTERANGNKRATDIMQPSLGVAFCGTYSIGKTSDRKLMSACAATGGEPLVDRLAPRISGTGLFACNPMQTTARLIAPIFSRIFESPNHGRRLFL
uniref:Major capsid protein n=1 Tax=Oryzias latipes TaxID=8090 RepID=A0A286P9T9_ORYLA|nr:major capsid protein [Oryzias latipes]